MRSALGVVIGLAARAEVTLFDEPYAGLGPVARQLFYGTGLNAKPVRVS
jgi:ABC-2 type transport system ATP-binding protein